MTLQEKVEQLLRYCGQYQSHGFMIDERNTDKDFNVRLPEEDEIRQSIEHIKVIILTGEAGDGKSRILRNIKELLEEHGFSEPCMDFSALTEEKKERLIRSLGQVFSGESKEKLIILANVGVFTQNAIKYNIHLMDELTSGRKDIYIRNFEKRNLAEDAESFQNILESFLRYEHSCENTDCICYGHCAYEKNIKKLLEASGIEAMRTICNAVYLTGGHITFRELLSLLAYTVTFGQNCQDRQRYLMEKGEEESISYENIFEGKGDALLRKVSDMDPAAGRGEYPDYIKTKEEYIRFRRREFFDAAEKQQYQMLHVDYLVEFYNVLQYMNQAPYHYDAARERDEALIKLKKGMNRLSSHGKSDTGLVVTDKPAMFDSRIRTEFLGIQDINLIWSRYDLQINGGRPQKSRLWNRFCLSYLADRNGKKELIRLVIDYPLFRYLMLCSEGFYMNRNGLNVEEGAVNTFYRKILQSKEQAYESIIIRFEEKSEELCDFSLTVHSHEDIFSGEKEQTIRIRKED